MAGMFYSLKETAERLGKTEDEVRQLAKDGTLREFRDGSHELFKVDEVNALLAEAIDIDMDDAGPWEPAAQEQPAEEFEAEPAAQEQLIEEFEAEPAAQPEEPIEEAAEARGDDMFQLEEEEMPDLEPAAEADASSELSLAPEPQEEGTSAEDELFFLEEEEQPDAEPAAASPDDALPKEEEIALAPETGVPALDSDITDMDTALTGEGVNVLGGTDTGYDVTEDSMAETVGPAGTSTEASLEEIEDDVNLDSFGSGSGLLDLSLQADDTSLGGILDEIYTAEGAEEGPAMAEPGSVDDITAEAEHVVPDEDLAMPEAVAVTPTVVPTYAAYAEAPPDAQSNILGMLLFLPLAALLYTAIVTVAAQRNVMPSILGSIQGLVWYIVGGAAVVAGIVIGASFMAGGERSKAAPKKAKEPKATKEKAKKGKKEKPAKEKKPLFGKKKAK